jgi:hypothetical protein
MWQVLPGGGVCAGGVCAGVCEVQPAKRTMAKTANMKANLN